MRSKFLPILALAIVFLFVVSALAQAKPDAPSAAKPDISKPAVNPLALTEAERTDLANLNARVIQADQILTARLRVILEIECEGCEDYPLKLAIDDARKFYRDVVKVAQAAYAKRLEEAQQRADCLGCALGKDGVFVRVEAAKK